jgi:hypothetical protein
MEVRSPYRQGRGPLGVNGRAKGPARELALCVSLQSNQDNWAHFVRDSFRFLIAATPLFSSLRTSGRYTHYALPDSSLRHSDVRSTHR